MNIITQNKKIITLSTVLLSALLLTGCGINSSQSTNNSSTNHNHSSKVIKPNNSTTNKSDANSISSNSSSNFSSQSPVASSASAQNSPEATQSVPADSNINPQSNTQASSSALSAPQSASNSQLAPSNSETQSNTTAAPTYQLTDADVINNFINDSGLIINQGDELSVAPVDVKAGIYQLELRHTDNTNPQVAHLTTLYTYNVNTHTYSVTYQASNPTQTTQQLGLNDTATWSDPDGTIHHVNSDGLDTITTLTGQTIYQDWFGPLPANAQIVHN